MKGLPDLRALCVGFDEDEILNSASAIAFQVLTALVPISLFLVALLGFFELDRVWDDAAKQLQPSLSPEAFTVLDETVRRILDRGQPFWLTAGAVLAIWRLSAAMRAVMGALDEIYCGERERPLKERFKVSILLSLAVVGLFILALAIVHLGPLLVPVDGVALTVLSIVVRWGAAAVLLLVAVGLTLHHAPKAPQSLGWVSFGSVLAVVAWLASSGAFGVYVTEIADYGSVFGAFATVFVGLSYLYLSVIAFLAGVELDAQVRRRTDGKDLPQPDQPSDGRMAVAR